MLLRLLLIPLLLLAACTFTAEPPPRIAPAPLKILVTDPLSDRIACACVAGYARRDYGKLAAFLEPRLGRPVHIIYANSVSEGIARIGIPPDVIIGKDSLMQADAKKANIPLRYLTTLTDLKGEVTLTGLFVIRSKDPGEDLRALEGKTILFGPRDEHEKASAAVEMLQNAGLTRWIARESPSCNVAAMAVVEGKADAAVVSSYAMPLLEGCGAIDKDALRIIGRTEAIPFVSVFLTSLAFPLESQLSDALNAVAFDRDLCTALESRDGFSVATHPKETPLRPFEHAPRQVDWPDWRGSDRDGQSRAVPLSLAPRQVWHAPLTALAMGGVTATERHVIVSDKEDPDDPNSAQDVWRCFDATNGASRWTLRYPSAPAPDESRMDYGDAPRASAVITAEHAYLLGARGDLYCVAIDSGKTVWNKNILKTYNAPLVTWGMCATPLLIDNKLIVNPGSPDAAVVALDAKTGQEIWKCPGDANSEAGYGSFIFANLGKVPQIVGYDRTSISGFDLTTGKRLWRIRPPHRGDFNVPTPLVVPVGRGDKLVLATENNGTRLYGFTANGVIRETPEASTDALRPETTSLVYSFHAIYGIDKKLVGLSLDRDHDKRPLEPLWELEDPAFREHASIMVGNCRLLILSMDGELVLVDIASQKGKILSRAHLLDPKTKLDCWSHPALIHTPAGSRLYVRLQRTLYCFELLNR